MLRFSYKVVSYINKPICYQFFEKLRKSRQNGDASVIGNFMKCDLETSSLHRLSLRIVFSVQILPKIFFLPLY
jgi:hypothetical protein